MLFYIIQSKPDNITTCMQRRKCVEKRNHQTPKHKAKPNQWTGFPRDESCNMKLDTDYGRIRGKHKIFGCVWNGIIYNKLWKVFYLVVFKSWKSFHSGECGLISHSLRMSDAAIATAARWWIWCWFVFLSGNHFHISENQTILSPFIFPSAHEY